VCSSDLRSLDEYTAVWHASSLSVCRASGSELEQPDELHDARKSCLQRRQGEFEALVSVLSSGEAVSLNAATRAAATLPSPRECVNATLTALEREPTSASALVAAYAELDRGAALLSAGQYARALELARAVREKAKAGPAEVEAAFLEARADLELSRFREAETALLETSRLASRRSGNALLAKSWLELSTVVGPELNRVAEAKVWALAAEQLLSRESGDLALQSLLKRKLGYIAELEGDHQRARTLHLEALALAETLYGPESAALLKPLNAVALIERVLGHRDEARAAFSRSHRIATERLGANHPDVGRVTSNLALLEEDEGRFEKARDGYRAALKILEASQPAEGMAVASAITGLSLVELGLGDLVNARAHGERALALKQQLLGRETIEVAGAISNLANIDVTKGDLARAEEGYRQALGIRERILGNDHLDLAPILTNLGQTLLMRERCREAIPVNTRSLLIREKSNPKHPKLALDLSILGQCQRALGQLDASIASLRRAVEVSQPRPGVRAQVQLELSETLWAMGARAEARQVAQAAQASFVEAGAKGEQAAEWLAAHAAH
jgi:tetratricopeptide (TPR) repeat protein